jgi:hypothetical protein
MTSILINLASTIAGIFVPIVQVFRFAKEFLILNIHTGNGFGIGSCLLEVR